MRRIAVIAARTRVRVATERLPDDGIPAGAAAAIPAAAFRTPAG
jgi:hypothetical protein